MIKQKMCALTIVVLFLLSAGIGSSINTVQTRNKQKIPFEETYDLLIIAPEEFIDELQPLLIHKNSVGMNTTLVSLKTILSSEQTSDGTDEAEKMKYYINYAFENNNISYVLLVGGKKGQSDEWYLPVRYVQMDNGWESKYMSDLYFADILDVNKSFSSWDSDNDNIYGEWIEGNKPEDHHIDLYPEVAVGRLPCRSSKEVTIIVNKIIEYETTTYQHPSFDSILAIAGDTYLEIDNPLWAGIEGEYYANQAIEYMNGFTPTRLFLSENDFTDSTKVIDEFSNGYGFVYFVGHGNPRTWGNHPPNDHEFVDGLQNHEMRKLTNKDLYPVCVVSGCHNCQFDVSIRHLLTGFLEDGFQFFSTKGGKVWRFEWVPECWGWQMTRQKQGGSIVTYGTTALGHTKEDKSSFSGGINELEVEMFRQYGNEHAIHAGDILKNAIGWYLDTYPVDWSTTNQTELLDTWVDVQVVESYVLIGDPSLRIGGYP